MDGSDYPPKTLYEIVIALQMYLESKGIFWKLIDDQFFTAVKYTLNNVMKERAQLGLGNEVHKASVLSFDQEEILWNTGLLGDTNPEQLLHTVVFLLGIHCALHAGKEHRSLHSPGNSSQFKWVFHAGVQQIQYTEDIGLKTNKGGLKHRKYKPKPVMIYPSENRACCPVRIFLRYVSKLPTMRKTTALYLRPKKFYTPDSWYLDSPVGVNTLANVVRDLCQKAGFEGLYTNHSLRATSVTRMYTQGIPEKVISEVSGHRSLAIHEYELVSEGQKCEASAALSTPPMAKCFKTN